MQNRSKAVKNDLFEELEFQEIDEKAQKFGEFQADSPLPARIIEWEVPGLGETIEKEARKFRIHPFAVRTGQAIGYVLVMSLSFVLQVAYHLVVVLVFVLAHVLKALFGQRHRFRQRHGQRQDIDWRDVPTGQRRTSSHHVRQSGQGHQNNVNINVHITNQ